MKIGEGHISLGHFWYTNIWDAGPPPQQHQHLLQAQACPNPTNSTSTIRHPTPPGGVLALRPDSHTVPRPHTVLRRHTLPRPHTVPPHHPHPLPCPHRRSPVTDHTAATMLYSIPSDTTGYGPKPQDFTFVELPRDGTHVSWTMHVRNGEYTVTMTFGSANEPTDISGCRLQGRRFSNAIIPMMRSQVGDRMLTSGSRRFKPVLGGVWVPAGMSTVRCLQLAVSPWTEGKCLQTNFFLFLQRHFFGGVWMWGIPRLIESPGQRMGGG